MWLIAVLLMAVSLGNCQITSNVQVKLKDGYCSRDVCKGLYFPSKQEVVSFDEASNNQTTIRFENTAFANFPLNLFLAFTNLSELDMRNCSIAHMTWENFLWAADLKVLLLSNNKLTKIDELTFSYALNLQFLWLESNNIRTLVSESFKGLTQLKYLSLQSNQIMYLPDGLFENLLNLEVVIFANNKIKYIQDNLFSVCPKLLSIDLKDNRIHNISDDAFKDLKTIMNLDISHNKPLRSLILNLDASNFYAQSCSLRQVNIYGHVNFALMSGNRILELYFSKPESLQRLDLKNNSLEQIASLTRAKNLNFLDISSNPKLGAVPDPWGIATLQKLDISNAGMREFPSSILGRKGTILELRYLNISGNSIREIDPNLYGRMENLTNFYFHANDWNCFSLRLMMELLIKPKQIAYSNDEHDPNFPGEYIDGIKCMFRAVEDDALDQPSASLKKVPDNALEEIEQLRNELKTIVRFYEEKFSKVIETVENLKNRLDTLTAENATVWEHITVMT